MLLMRIFFARFARLLPLLAVFAGLVPAGLFAQTANPHVTRSPSGGSTPGPVHGLLAEYYHGTQFNDKLFSQTEQQVNYQYGHQAYLPGLDELNFSARWTGRLYAPQDGAYTLVMQVDDGIRLWLGGKLLVDEWHGQSVITYTRVVKMKAGHYYPLKIEYFNHHGPGVMKLSWELPEENSNSVASAFGSRPRTVIPAGYFFVPRQVTARKPAVATQPAATDQTTVAAKPATPAKTALPKPEPAKAGIALPRRKPEPVKARAAVPPPPQPQPVAEVTAGNKREEVTAEAPRAEATFEEPEPGKAVVLEQVLFEQSQYRLLPSSYAQLDKLANTLLKYPHLTIQVAGHTDNVGDPRLNLALSEHRALVVTHYLQRKGVAEGRIKARGYGGTRPLAPNTTETERAKNRRVEFTVEEGSKRVETKD
jgi:outer membrane protein OmpA-like peptidoglycan-associated protein